MKRLFLLFHGRFPGEKAASLFTAKNAEAFVNEGFDVTLVVPKRKGVSEENPFIFYGVKNNFKIVYLPIIDIFASKLGKYLAFVLSVSSFSWSIFWYLKKNSKPEDVIYSNEIQPMFLVSHLRNNCFYEMHDFPESKLYLFGYVLNKMRWILVHNKWKLEQTQKLFPHIDYKKFLYEPNAVDITAFDLDISTKDARKIVGLPQDKKIAVYTGHLYGWKGVDTLAQSAELLDENFLVVFVGGTDKDIKEFRNKYGSSKKIMIVGHKPHKDIPLWQKSSDVLILPNTAKEAISTHYTSPMKLFEYMASKRPIIASDIPSIREIVSDRSAILISPDNSQKLGQAITSLISSPKRQEEIVEQSFKYVSNHTWDKRARRIVDFMKTSK